MKFKNCLSCNTDSILFSLPDVFIAVVMLHFYIQYWAFYFQGSGLVLSFCRTWSGSVCNVHMPYQDLQGVELMLYGIVFLSGNVCALHLENSPTKAYLCKQGGTVSPFLSRLACHLFNLAN